MSKNLYTTALLPLNLLTNYFNLQLKQILYLLSLAVHEDNRQLVMDQKVFL